MSGATGVDGVVDSLPATTIADGIGGAGGRGGGGGGGGGVTGVVAGAGTNMRSDTFGNLVVPVGGGVFGSVVVPANVGANSVQEWINTPCHPNPNAASGTGECVSFWMHRRSGVNDHFG